MKKLFALALAVMMVTSMAVVASAESTTTLTTTVPAATYTLNIPADQIIAFGTTETNIGTVTVSDATGFAVGKNLKVAVAYDAFMCEGIATTIPFSLTGENSEAASGYDSVDLPSGSVLTFYGKSNNGVTGYPQESFKYRDAATQLVQTMGNVDGIIMSISSDSWGKALAGNYTATITFTTEVVVEE